MCFTKPRRGWSLLLSAALSFAAVPAFAQADRGTIQGLVTDASGAVVPGARVEVVHTDTNSPVSVSTNGQGLYTVPNLARGSYRVLVTKDGFAPAVAGGMALRAG